MPVLAMMSRPCLKYPTHISPSMAMSESVLSLREVMHSYSQVEIDLAVLYQIHLQSTLKNLKFRT